MFDTMTMTKAVGAVCGSLLVFLLAGWAATSLYTVGGHGEGYGEEVAQAYVIETGSEEPAAAAEEGPDFATLLASADAAAGEAVFKKCGSCHKLDGSDGVGPHLNGIVGRMHAAAAGYSYSEANLALAGEPWTPEAINAFIEDPKGYMPGTKMSFAGLPKAVDRANLIAFLATTK
ncbi:MAG: c-type cytochrome [Tabrizicola sp.]|uniref:c-type cytochrome n=1 Tax=Tabrizicola sp. TaxID=2005166 RepID=UPI0027353C57|nr:c-type cytochrome [Tabrizicola sp.]MDP3262333.1 c-type cytochrome [Tabrizicola sp.]MDP3647920.1 c-type cytochrome [Paracoccaceae bacterium]MDZ4069932.1 c-type cytochrome [Tabrizicola sp.]